jgi:nucleotide-binding universal stress UspA family protein
MKNILIATDFSPGACRAAVHAAQLARRSGARLILLHIFQPNETIEAEESPEEILPSEKEAQLKLDALAQELHTQYGISVTRLVKPGFATDEITALAKRMNAEVVAIEAAETYTSGVEPL